MSGYKIGEKGIIGMIFHALSIIAAPAWVGGTSMYIPSTQEVETYAALGQVPMMREWVGGRDAKPLRESDYQIRNKIFEATLEVLVDDMRRDKTGQLRIRIAELARRAQGHWAKLLSDLLFLGPLILTRFRPVLTDRVLDTVPLFSGKALTMARK